VVEPVGQGLADLAALGHSRQALLEPGFERLDDRPGAILARPPAQFGRQPAYLVLDRIELLDARKRLRRDRAMTADIDLVELPA
jgi:hypothetical protein